MNDFEWDIRFPTIKFIRVHGVKLVYAGLKLYKYEGIIFESTENLSFRDNIFIKFSLSDTSNCATVFNFRQITDTLVQFDLLQNYPVDACDFQLEFYDLKK